MKKLEKIKESQKLSFREIGLINGGLMNSTIIGTGAGSIGSGYTRMYFRSDSKEDRPWPLRDKYTYYGTTYVSGPQ